MAYPKVAMKFSLLLVVLSFVAVHRINLIMAQLQVQPQTNPPQQVQSQQQPLQQATLQQVQSPLVQQQPPSQTPQETPAKIQGLTMGPPMMTAQPLVPVVKSQSSPLRNATLPAPKNRMKILKAAMNDSPMKSFFSSLVDVDRAQNRSKVGVHIPLIFDMTNDKDSSSGKSKLDLTVLSGLVSVNKDRENGKGPMTVTVFGIPVYTGAGNKGLRDLTSRLESRLGDQKRKLDNFQGNIVGNDQFPDAAKQLYSNIQRTREKSISTITGQLDKMSSFLKEQAPIANLNGNAASINNNPFITRLPKQSIQQTRPEAVKARVPEVAPLKMVPASSNSTANDLSLQSL